MKTLHEISVNPIGPVEHVMLRILSPPPPVSLEKTPIHVYKPTFCTLDFHLLNGFSN